MQNNFVGCGKAVVLSVLSGSSGCIFYPTDGLLF